MCRFFSYSGPTTLMNHWLFDSSHSLVSQSRAAKMRGEPVNGDGFGIGWYPVHDDQEAGTFVSIEPAWNNRNLSQISRKIQTQHFFGHVRDATGGLSVSLSNCHPFQFANLLWMHNGQFEEFEKIRRPLVNQLSDRAFSFLQGNTDSEYAFALFLDALDFDENASTEAMKNAMLATIEKVMKLRCEAGADSNSYMNFAVTNKKTSLFTRFATQEGKQPASLFYYKDNVEGGPLIVSSEPLTVNRDNWTKVERNEMVCIEDMKHLTVEMMPLSFQPQLKAVC